MKLACKIPTKMSLNLKKQKKKNNNKLTQEYIYIYICLHHLFRKRFCSAFKFFYEKKKYLEKLPK